MKIYDFAFNDAKHIRSNVGVLSLNVKVEKNFWKDRKKQIMGRIYHFPFRNYCPEKCVACPGMGQKSRQDRTIEELEFSLLKAKSGSYKFFQLPCNALFSEDLNRFLIRIQKAELTPIVQINIKSYSAQWELKFKEWGRLRLQLVIENWDARSISKVQQFFSAAHKNSEQSRDVLFAVTHQIDLELAVKQLSSDSFERSRFYFPLKLNKSDHHYLDNDEIVSLLKTFKKIGVDLRPLEGVDVHDPRIHESANLEAKISSEHIGSPLEGQSNLKFSVVIPSYNNGPYVQNTVHHLAKQTMNKHEFEVIVVDDGSQDDTKQRLVALQETLIEKINLKYIFFPRPQERKMGDGQFRAGLARNLGVKNALGKYVCFLDSDIITPKTFLETLNEQHLSYDGIQTKRIYLTEAASSENTKYEEVNEDSDVFIPEGGYWQKFYDDPTPWMERKGNWKYACTYNFSLSREKFMELGWFRKNFHFYGFEDTDLGLRLVRSGGKLLLSDLKVYHLFHINDKSEFKNSDYLRQMVLRKTAKIFFHNSLDLEIHEQLGGLLTEKSFLKAASDGVRMRFAPTPLEKSILWAKHSKMTSSTSPITNPAK